MSCLPIGGAYDLAALGHQPRRPQLLVEARKQLVDQPVPGQLLAEQPQRLGVGYRIFRRRNYSPLEAPSLRDARLTT